MNANQHGFCWRILKLQHVIFVHLLTSTTHVIGQIKTISAPEGIYDYPKILAKVEIPFTESVICSIDSVRFTPPNGLRAKMKPKLFGVETGRETNLTRNRRSVTAAVSLSTQNDHKIYVKHDISTSTSLPMFQKTTMPEEMTVSSGASSTKFQKLESTSSPLYPTIDSSTTAFVTTSPITVLGTTQNQTTLPASSTASSPGYAFHLVQLYDLDREKEDKHLVTVHCVDTNASSTKRDMGDLFLIKVKDINDNTPIFEKASLESTVSKNITSGDAALLLKATDADIGINALLLFGSVRGTERLLYKNETKKVHAPVPSIAVLHSGYVIMLQKYEREVTITFKVTVKDRGSHSDGNRATATATINIYGTLPPSPSAGSSQVMWWWIALPCAIVLFFVVLTVTLMFKRFTKKRRTRRDLLVIDDGRFLENDGQSDVPVSHSRADSDHVFQELRNSQVFDDDALIT